MTPQKQNYALPIAMMFALFFVLAFVTGLPAPVGVIITSQFHASVFQSQMGVFCIFIAYAFMGIPAGMLLRRFGYKRTALAAIAVGMAGVGVQFLSAEVGSYGIFLAGSFIAGVCVCMLNTVINPMLNSLGGEGRRGNQLIQFGGAFNSLGATLAPMLVGYLMGAEAARTLDKTTPVFLLALGIFLLAFVVLWFVRIPEPQAAEPAAAQPQARGLRGPLAFRHFVLGIVAIFLYVGVEVSIPGTANHYMTSDLGLTEKLAGTFVGIYWFSMLVGRLLGGALGAWMSSRTMLTAVATIALCLVGGAIFLPQGYSLDLPELLGGVSVPVSIVLLTLCGLCMSVMWGSIFNLAVAGLGRYTALASGIFMVMVCGGGILPLVQGYVADVAGYPVSYWVVFAGLLYILYYALAGSRPSGKGSREVLKEQGE